DNPHKIEDQSDEQKRSEFSGNKANFEYKGRKSLTSLEQAIEYFEIDTEQWEVEKFTANSWDVTNKHGITYTNYQIKLFLVKKTIQTDPNLFLTFVSEQLFK